MRHVYIFLIAAITVIGLCSYSEKGGPYEVLRNTNVYSNFIYGEDLDRPDLVIGHLKEGDTIMATSIYTKLSHHWVIFNYNGRKGYVVMNDMSPIVETTTSTDDGDGNVDKPHREESLFDKATFNSFPKTTSKLWFWVAAILAMLMTVLCFGVQSDEVNLFEFDAFIANSLIFLFTSVAELVYFATIKGDDTWFVSPRAVGWIWTLINFVVFTGVVYAQMCSLSNIVLASNVQGGRPVSLSVGYWGMFGGLLVALFCSVFKKSWLDSVFYLILVSQAVQILLMVIANVRDRGNYFNLLYTIVLYCVGMVAFVVVLKAYLGVMLLVAFVVMFLAGVKVSDFSSANSSRRPEGEGWIMGPHGPIRGEWGSDGLLHSDDGHRYTSSGQKWD